MFEEMKNQTVLITGATGLIGQALIRKLVQYNVKVIAIARNKEKATKLFGTNEKITFVFSDIRELEVKNYNVDYIIHAASNTSSKAFIQDPVGVINIALEGTIRTLEIAKVSNVKGYVYLSSMEVYGAPTTDEKIDELHSTNLNTMEPRSSYPESKRMCESLCTSYATQFGVPAKVIRLTQTFGPGVSYNDGRVFAEFARCVIEGRDIILHTKGNTKRSYLYTEDAVDAIITVMLKGEVGEAYNAANEETYCSIYEMADMVARECCLGNIRVLIEESELEAFGYAPTLHTNLNTCKLQSLGWKPKTGLIDMYMKMIEAMKAWK